MTKKLPISPDISYMLGIYRCNNIYRNLCLSSSNSKLIERFVRIAVTELGTKTGSITVTKDDNITTAEIRNSKLKKLLGNALDKREKIFKYKNEYSASYFAGMFDCNGAVDNRGMFIKGMDSYDSIALERIGFHTKTSPGKCYIRNRMDFIMFIAPFSIKAQAISNANKLHEFKIV